MSKRVAVTLDTAEQLREEYGGVCRACGELAWGGVEPDAHDVECEFCGAQKVMGVEDAVLMGYLVIRDEEAEYAHDE